MATCSVCGGAMLTERPHRHPSDLRAAVEGLVKRQPHGNWDSGWNAAIAATRATIDAHDDERRKQMAAVRDYERHSAPIHSATCASQDDDEPCICGTSDAYERFLAALDEVKP